MEKQPVEDVMYIQHGDFSIDFLFFFSRGSTITYETEAVERVSKPQKQCQPSAGVIDTS